MQYFWEDPSSHEKPRKKTYEPREVRIIIREKGFEEIEIFVNLSGNFDDGGESPDVYLQTLVPKNSSGPYYLGAKRLGSSQQVIYLLLSWVSTKNINIIRDAFMRQTDSDSLFELVSSLSELADMLLYTQLMDFIQSFFDDYLSKTLLKNTSALKKIQLFANENNCIAGAIWKFMFSTKEKRKVWSLSKYINISDRYYTCFLESESLEELIVSINTKRKNIASKSKTQYDCLSDDLRKRIKDIDEKIEYTNCYRYISPYQMDEYKAKLHNLWKEADREVTLYNRK